MKRKNIIILVLTIFVFAGIAITYIGYGTSTDDLGGDSNGNVNKTTINYLGMFLGEPKHKIAIVSGMHPRENLSKNVLPEVAWKYGFFNNVEIVNYQINVTNRPDNFVASRINGESLVAKYVIPDINKENFDLVIIGHDHEEGYGEGYYIATPTLDDKSMKLADKTIKIIPEFKHYKRDESKEIKSNSILTVDFPITNNGTPLFVYEIPEWLGFDEVFGESYKLFDASVKALDS
ncbi:MAG: hypothetical protein ACRCVG_00505 [Methanobacteriaceae archaeon]